jgi:hypothetical protein
VFVVFLLAPLPWGVAHFFPPHNLDAAAVLQFAQRWLAGETLYGDLLDINPPLIFMLNLLPAAIGQYTSISATAALTGCVLAYIAFGFTLFTRLLSRDTVLGADSYRVLLPPLFLFLTIVYPGQDFAQREHLLVASMLPYLLLAWHRAHRREVGPWLAGAVSVFAAVGFAIKPYFLLIPVLVELYLAAVRRPDETMRDPVPWLMLGVFAGYLALVVSVFHSYLDLLPLIREHYFDMGVEQRFGRLRTLFNSRLTPVAAVLVPLVCWSLLATRGHLSRLVSMAAIGAVLVALIQAKEWSYQLLPAECMAVFLACVLVCQSLRITGPGYAGRAHHRNSLKLMFAFMLALYYFAAVARPVAPYKLGYFHSPAAQVLAKVRQHAAGERVLWLGTELGFAFPTLNYADSPLAMRHMNLWLLQSFYGSCLPDGRAFREPSDMPTAERSLFESVADDLARHEPRLVVVEKQPGMAWCGRHFDLVGYFTRSPRFAALWAAYDIVDEDQQFVYLARR